jgi:hypothetical protein
MEDWMGQDHIWAVAPYDKKKKQKKKKNSFINVLESKNVCRATKWKFYKTVVRLVVTYYANTHGS